jgi:hypothetical protein
LAKLNSMATTKKTTFLSEDLRLEVLIHGRDKPEFLVHFVRADFIYRISESIEYRNMACVWVSGENDEAPLIVNAYVDDLYRAWVEGRKNAYMNQITLAQ